ncbi:hypothetical protein LSM04_009501 [Trypanosoma melophagium]|uniref:uncharacterized protein n=1 Tax=Trypanosoma melophagium TaxID=715481 RepID=UPI003519E928|nr:hypothetical protein LSM04_009501 [Trypanosoma melophagium]
MCHCFFLDYICLCCKRVSNEKEKKEVMNTSSSISNIQKDQEYLHSHNVRGVIERLIADIVRDKPENACEYMARWAAKQREASQGSGTRV